MGLIYLGETDTRGLRPILAIEANALSHSNMIARRAQHTDDARGDRPSRINQPVRQGCGERRPKPGREIRGHQVGTSLTAIIAGERLTSL